jgi:hypothetical protein
MSHYIVLKYVIHMYIHTHDKLRGDSATLYVMYAEPFLIFHHTYMVACDMQALYETLKMALDIVYHFEIDSEMAVYLIVDFNQLGTAGVNQLVTALQGHRSLRYAMATYPFVRIHTWTFRRNKCT